MKHFLTTWSRQIVALLVLMGSLLPSTYAQTIQLGSGTTTNGTTQAGPNNIWFRSSVMHIVYTAAEINAQGITGPCDLTEMGFYITQQSLHPKPNYTIKMGNVSQSDVANAIPAADLVQVKNITSYHPSPTGYDMIVLDDPFEWDGTSNVGVEICWDQVTAFNGSGQVRIYDETNGFRYSWSDITNQCGQTPGVVNSNKPQVQLEFTCGPCQDPPIAGITTTDIEEPCAGTPFRLRLDSNTSGAGQSYQWQISDDGDLWTDLAGDTTASALRTQNSTNFYRAIVSCGSGVDTSAPVEVITEINPMNGVYTVDPNRPADSTNFTSLEQAFDRMECSGITGEVQLQVASGFYNDNFTIGNVPNASADRRVIIDGGHMDSVTIENATNTVFTINGKHIVLRNMTISRTGADFGTEAILVEDTDSVLIEKNRVTRGMGTSSTAYGIYVNNSNYVTVRDNEVIGGGNGVRFNAPFNTPTTGNQLIGNHIVESGYYSFYAYEQSNTLVLGNTAELSSNASTFGSTYFFSRVNSPKVSKNKAFRFTRYGFYFTTTDNALISNNMAGAQITYSSTSISLTIAAAAYYVNNSNNCEIYNNTGFIDGTTVSQIYALGLVTGGGHDVRNNILYNNASVQNGLAIMTSNSTPSELDHNVYFSAGNNLANVGSEFPNLSSWQSQTPNFNINAYEDNVDFESTPNDLYLGSNAPKYFGEPLSGIVYDIDSVVRCGAIPTIGADEGDFPADPPNAVFQGSDTVWLASPSTQFFNGADPEIPQLYSWYVDDVFITDELHLTHQFNDQGTAEVKLVVENCGGLDSMVQTVIVDTPSIAPVVDFIAEPNIVTTFGRVQLTDLSEYGPTSWSWEVNHENPNIDPMDAFLVVNGSLTSQNPEILFLESGLYEVCLTATNLRDTSDRVCKVDYIEVVGEFFMCVDGSQRQVTEAPTGVLHDDGGPGVEHGSDLRPGFNCGGFLIDVCAAEVNFEFSALELRTGDYLRVYDGVDTNGIPLWDVSNEPLGFNGELDDLRSTVITAQSGKMYFEFVTAASGNKGLGFTGTWTSVPGTFDPPVAAIQGPDSFCVNAPDFLMSNSQGDGLRYRWLNEAGQPISGAVRSEQEFIFPSQGVFEVGLVVESCGGIDTAYQQVVVVQPSSSPIADFEVSNDRPVVNQDVVELSALIDGCAESFEWQISPANFSFVNGTSPNDVRPQVVFEENGCYDVTLVVENAVGVDTFSQTCAIEAIGYCRPIVVNLTSDIGINLVQFGAIDNPSRSGVRGYNDYTNSQETTVERGAMQHITISRNTTLNQMNRKVWIDYNQDGIFDPVEELVVVENATQEATLVDSFVVPLSARLGKTRMRIGTAFGAQTNSPCGPNVFGEFEDYSILVVEDNTPPEMTFNTPGDISIARCAGFVGVDTSATAIDNVDGDISDRIETVYDINFDMEGSYEMAYKVEDVAGNQTILTRMVHITPDTSKPQIELIGDDVVEVAVFEVYQDLGFEANDDCSGIDRVEEDDDVNTLILGSYQYNYTAFDSSGNSSRISRTVVVVDTVAPTLIDASIGEFDTINLEVMTVLEQPIIEFEDNYDTDLSVELTGTYYQSFPRGRADTLGVFEVNYTAVDQSGNATSFTYFVNVQDTEPPVVLIDDLPLINIPRWSTFAVDTLLTITDNFDQNPDLVTTGSYMDEYLLDYEAGLYEIHYVAVDQSGNESARVTRVVNVEEVLSIDSKVISSLSIYPNPTKDDFKIDYQLKNQENIHISLLNTLGKEIRVLHDGLSSGDVLDVDMSNLPAGVYMVRFTTDEENVVKRLVLTK